MRTERNLNMATTQSFCDLVIESFSCAGNISVKKMMGEYCLYHNDKLIGVLCDNQCFLKSTPASDMLLKDGKTAYPYEGSKQLMHFFEDFENKEKIEKLLTQMWNELPAKKPRKKRKA